jgi:hypothetical protein
MVEASARRGLESASYSSAISHLVPGSTFRNLPPPFLSDPSCWQPLQVSSAREVGPGSSLYTDIPVVSVSGQPRLASP